MFDLLTPPEGDENRTGCRVIDPFVVLPKLSRPTALHCASLDHLKAALFRKAKRETVQGVFFSFEVFVPTVKTDLKPFAKSMKRYVKVLGVFTGDGDVMVASRDFKTIVFF